MDETPTVNRPLYALVRSRVMRRRDEYKMRHVQQLNTLFCDGLFVCPADTPDAAIGRLNHDLEGVAFCGQWHWIDPNDEYGDCFFVELVARAN